MDAISEGYRLSCELRGHDADVRGLCVCGDNGIATSSRDKTVKFWVQNSDHGYRLSKTLAEHTRFVGPLAWIAPCNDFPEGGIVSGGMDTMILLWDLNSARTVHRMSGHQLQAQSHLSIKEMEFTRLNAIITVLKDTSHYHSSTFVGVDICLLEKLLDSWPTTMLFPVFDIMGMASCILMGPDYFTSKLKDMMLDKFSCCCTSTNKNLQLAYSTLLLNFTVLLIQEKDQEGQAQVLSAALEIAEENQDPDAKFRALVAVGSLMLEGLVKQVALDFDVKNIAMAAMDSKEAKIAEVGADIESLTRTP